MSQKSMAELVELLCESSRRNFANPYTSMEWPDAIDPEREWLMSPQLCSLFDTPIWNALSERAQKRLAFCEATNFFSLNIHGERALMQGLAERLYRPRTQDISRYLHHFLDEENKHSVLFGTFCERYAKKIYPDRKLVIAAAEDDALESDFMFFAKVLIFEEVVDTYNLAMSKDRRLHPIAIAINHNHHVEEARHLAFGRRICQELWGELARERSSEELDSLREHLRAFLTLTWREYYNPDVYRDAELGPDLPTPWAELDPWQVQAMAWSHPSAVARRTELSSRCTSFLNLLERMEGAQ